MDSPHPDRRRVVAAGLGALAGAAAWPALAQNAPSANSAPAGRPATLVVPYPAGGSSDYLARALEPGLTRQLGSPVVIENVGGVAGALGAQRVLTASADAHTMLLGSPNEVILAPLAVRAVRYKPQDFRLVAHVTTGPMVLYARADLPANNIDELIGLARSLGDKPLAYASVGIGSLYHLIAAHLANTASLKLTHIPYRGATPAMQDLGGGQVDLAFLPLIPTYVQMIETGRIKALGITAPARSPVLPKVPTFDEGRLLRNFHFSNWAGIFVSQGTPEAAAAQLGKACNEAIHESGFLGALSKAGAAPGVVYALDTAAAFYRTESDRFLSIARSIRLEPE